jgi:hypothetical protein
MAPVRHSVLRLVALLALLAASAPLAEAALMPPLKPSAARKKRRAAVPAAAGRATPAPRPTSATPAPKAPSASPPAASPGAPAASPLAATSLTPEAPAAGPEVVHPAARADLWRPASANAAYHGANAYDVTLWQGDWAIGGRITAFEPGVATVRAAPGGLLGDGTLRHRFRLGGHGLLVAELGWHSGLSPVGMALAGVGGEWRLRGGWLTARGGIAAAGFPIGGARLLDAQLGLVARLGPAGLGVGWRHLAYSAEGRASGGGVAEQHTGPFLSGELAF